MVFRKIDNKLYDIVLEIEDELQFVQEQSNPEAGIEYIYIPDEDESSGSGSGCGIYYTLPENPYPTDAYYYIDENDEIQLDLDRMLDDFKASTVASINSTKNWYIAQGFNWTRTIENEDGTTEEITYNFPLTQEYINGLLAMSTAALMGKTEGLYFITSDNIIVDNLTPDEAKDLALTGEDVASTLIYKARIYKDNVLKATTFEEVIQAIEDMKAEQ